MRVVVAGFLLPFVLCLASTGCKKSAPPEPPEESAADDAPNATFWQLRDDSELNVVITPWPPEGGRARLTAQASLGDGSDSVNQTRDVAVRVGGAGRYTSMTRSGPDANGVLTFTADLALPAGAQPVQLRVTSIGGDFVDLDDWTVKVP